MDDCVGTCFPKLPSMVILRVAQDKTRPFVFVPAGECFHEDQSQYIEGWLAKSKLINDRPAASSYETIEPVLVLMLT